MTQINLPQDMLQKEAFKALPSKEKGEYLSNVLKKILELNPEGITIAQIKEATGFTYSTIWHHLEILSHTAQCHKVSKGNIDVYHHQSSISHLNEHEKGKFHYSISIVEHDKGKFVCIHEKRENRLGNQTVSSGVKIPLELLDEVIETLSKVKKS
jgi:hypothetical protein